MVTLIITLFVIFWTLTFTFNALLSEEELSRTEEIYRFFCCISLFTLPGMALFSNDFADYPVINTISTTLLSILLIISSIVALFVWRTKADILNVLFYCLIIMFLVYEFNHQPIAEINICKQVELCNGATAFQLTDTTHYCSWNIKDPKTFTVIKKDRNITTGDKCIWCGNGIGEHHDIQYTEEEYKEEQERQAAMIPDPYPY